MTAAQAAKAARLQAFRAQRKLRQRQVAHAAAYQRSEWARRLRAKGLTWKEVADKLGVKSQFTARTISTRNPHP